MIYSLGYGAIGPNPTLLLVVLAGSNQLPVAFQTSRADPVLLCSAVNGAAGFTHMPAVMEFTLPETVTEFPKAMFEFAGFSVPEPEVAHPG